MHLNASHEEIARQFVNEDRTAIRSPKPYPMWRQAAEVLARKLLEVKTGPASLMAYELLWYRDVFDSWTPQTPEEERSKKNTEFLLCYQKHMSYYDSLQRGGLR